MHKTQTIATDERDVSPSVESAAARAVCAACGVRGLIRCSLRQLTLAFCYTKFVQGR